VVSVYIYQSVQYYRSSLCRVSLSPSSCQCTVPRLRALRHGALLLICEGSIIFPPSDIPQEARKKQGEATHWRMMVVLAPARVGYNIKTRHRRDLILSPHTGINRKTLSRTSQSQVLSESAEFPEPRAEEQPARFSSQSMTSICRKCQLHR
jgi:hypothetical protein